MTRMSQTFKPNSGIYVTTPVQLLWETVAIFHVTWTQGYVVPHTVTDDSGRCVTNIGYLDRS